MSATQFTALGGGIAAALTALATVITMRATSKKADVDRDRVIVDAASSVVTMVRGELEQVHLRLAAETVRCDALSARVHQLEQVARQHQNIDRRRDFRDDQRKGET